MAVRIRNGNGWKLLETVSNPDRLDFVESIESCTFCDIVEGAEPAFFIYENEQCVAFLDRAPITEGHTLVMPRRHVRNLYDVDSAVATEIMASMVHVGRVLKHALDPDGLTVVQTNEGAGGQSVFHVHFHLIPRWQGDGVIRPWVRRAHDVVDFAECRTRILAGAT